MDSVKIGILSDVHKQRGLQQDAIAHLKDRGASFLIHAGDFSTKQNLQDLKDSGIAYCAVFGNNDAALLECKEQFEIHKEPHYFKYRGIKFKLMHIPFYLSGDVDVVIFGHTHAFECEKKGNTLFINPGEVCARNKPISEYALLEISDKHYYINYFYKELESAKLYTKEFQYDR